jgi:hypothetical protein
MNILKSLTLVTGTVLFAGCAATGVGSGSTSSYEPPKKREFQNSIVINESSEVVWNRLVEKLSTSFFSINNIEKASRLINVSISSSSPEQYIDCGTTYRSNSFAGQTNNYSYLTAGSAQYTYSAKHPQNAMLTVNSTINRDVALDGRVNIYLAPEGSGTKVSVNAIYNLDVELSGVQTVYNAFGGAVASQNLNNPLNGWANFTTSTPDTSTINKEGVVCVSMGVLEEQILKMANN